MADQKSAAAAKLTSGSETHLTLAEDGTAALSVNSADIENMSVNSDGSLTISFKPETGRGEIVVENFRALVQNGSAIALNDGKSIDTRSLYQALPHAEANAESVTIARPHAGEMVTINMADGHKYILPGELHNAQVVEKGGALIITFADNGILVLAHFADAMKGMDASSLVTDGKTYDLAAFRGEFHLAGDNAQIAQNDAMDKLAQQLAGVEPAAGPNGAGGVASAGGFGFQSSIAPAVLGVIPPVGPIGPTELGFGLPEGSRDRFLVLDQPDVDAFPPGITVNNGLVNAIHSPDAIVKEDGSIFVPIQATLDPAGSANQVLTVTVTGIDPSWNITITDGTYNAATGTWTITLAPGQNYNGGLTFAPPADTDIDLTGLTATATSFDPAAGESASSSTDFDVITDAVADVPDLDAAAATVEEGKTVALVIHTAVNDTDGSEAITKITIEGLPTGATLNHGTVSGGVWTLTPSDLTGLTLTVPDNRDGHYDLVVKSYAEEINLSGKEVDFTDNIAVATDVLKLTVTNDDEPVLTQPVIKTVDETDLTGAGITVGGTLTASVGADGPGKFDPTGAFAGSTALTSGGQPVTVTLVGDTYTGAANGHTIFTLTVNDNGTYSFKLLDTLDHPNTSNPNDSIALSFGVQVADTDGDVAQGNIVINVLDDGPVAHNDVNTFESDNGAATGNVVTGLNGGPGAADTLSQDTPNTVSKISFGGTTVDVPTSGTASIQGLYGTLTIKADGTYTYTLKSDWMSNVPGNSEHLSPVAADVAGTQSSFTKNGITVTSLTGGDLVWTVRSDGTGIGVAGNGTDKIFKGGEGVAVDFAAADSVSIKIADIGTSDLQSVIGMKVYVEGNPNPIIHNIDLATTTPVNGYITVNLDGADFGGQITKFEIFSTLSTANGKESSFMLADVTTLDNCGCGCPTDQFTYTLKDGDGDKDTATLSFACAPDDHPVVTQPITQTVDESNLTGGDQVVTGTITANFGADGPGTFGGSGTFTSSTPVTAGGVPVTVSQTGNTYTGTAGGHTVFTLTVNTDGSYTFTLKEPIDHPDATNPDDVIALNFGIRATDSDGDSSGGTITIRVLDDGPVAHNDVNTFNATVGLVENGNVITGVNGGAGAADAKSQDTPNTVTKITFGGTNVTVPATGEATINGDHGVLKIKADGSYTYTLTDTGTGSKVADQFTYTLKDGDGDISTATLKLEGSVGDTTVTIVVKDPDGHVIADGGNTIVKEDHSTLISVAVDGTGSGTQVLTVTLTGINPAWGFQSLNGGTYNAATGTWTATLAPGQDFNGTFRFAPPHDSDLDLSNLKITATSNDAAIGRTATASDMFNIITDAVADAPNLSASGSSGEEGTTVALHIATSVTDTDGSEAIQKVEISGLPSGATLNHGSVAGGVWTVSKADLADLKISIADGTHDGNYTLTVKSYSKEVNLGGTEVDLTDNVATATTTLNLCVTKDDVPVITDPAVKTVDESDLTGTGITVNGHVDASFGGDTGSITGNNTFTSTVALTSGGVPVMVSQAGNVYTGVANGHTIFTLTINANGDYSFKLLDTLDHPNKADANDAINLNFGVKATDSDGDATNGHIVIKVLDDGPVAHNDINGFNASVGLVENGNVITGQNGGAGAADDKSQDTPNTVTKIAFGGTNVTVPATGEATINGDHGVLKIKADGSYTYTVTNTGTGHAIADQFTYTLKDGDGDTSTATLKMDGCVGDTTVTIVVKDPDGHVIADGSDTIVKEDHSTLISVAVDGTGSGTQVLTVTLTGINPAWGFQSLNGGTYNAATGTWTATLAPGQDFNGTFRFAPPHDSDLDLSNLKITATSNDTAIGRTATADDMFNIVVDAVADKPDLSASGSTGEEGTAVALHITTAVTDTDGSEAIQKVEISGLPAGATLNHGTATGGVWTVSKADLADLKINLADGTHEGNYTLTVKSYAKEVNLGGTEVDLTDNVATATTTLNLCVTKDDAPVITDPAVKTVDESDLTGTGITVNGHVTTDYGTDGGSLSGNNIFTSSVALTSGGVPVTVTLSGNTYTGMANGQTIFTLVINANGDYSFKLLDTLDHPNKADANDAINLNFGVKATDSDGDVANGHIIVKVLDDGPVAHDDVNGFNATVGATDSGNVITGANGGAGAADDKSQDTPNTVTKITFGGTNVTVPATGEATINGDHGVLKIKADGSYTYTLTDTGTGNAVSDQFTYTLKDGDGDTSTAMLKLDGHVGNVDIDLCVNNNADNVIVKEDGSVLVGVTADASGSGTQVLTVTLTGINPAWGFQSLNGGTYNAATGTWTATLAPGQDFNGTFRFAPPHDSDLDLSNLKVTATVNDAALGRTTSASDTFNIIVDAVADVPNLTASGSSGEEGTTVALHIATSVTDTDGSEAIQKVEISGLPSGATLNHGSVAGGVWTVSKADLADLKISIADGTHDGNYTLTVKSYAKEVNLGGTEVDLTDNVATATTTLNLCVTKDDAPVITDPAVKTVDETDLTGAGITVNGHINATYGSDTGSISGSGAFTSSTALTSGGAPVTVALAGNTYTGTANGHAIFTLTINANGDYSFKLLDTLDHPNKADANDAINLNFGVKATDSDGDVANGNVVIKVLDDGPVAHDDFNSFSATIGATDSGNVITGANGGVGAADTKSQDTPNTVSKVSFGGTTVDVPASGFATISGDHGTLKIAADGSYTYTVTNTGSGHDITDAFTYTLKDGDGDTDTACLTLKGSVCDVNVDLCVNNNAENVIVKEDGSVVVNVTADGTGSGSQVITLTMTGINPAWNFASLNGGTYNAATGTWTKTLAAGQDFNGNFTFAPPHDSDIDLNNIKVTATVNDAAAGRTATANDTFNIIVDAVADTPNLTASNATGEEGTAVALNIATSVKDTDGSEAIQKVEISGLPSGATLNHGSVAGGVWTVSKADLADLKINLADGTHEGNYTLTVKSYAKEVNLGGMEVDLTDNVATATKTLNLCVTHDDQPILVDPAAKTVDETNLKNGIVTVSGAVTGTFGADGPGKFAGTGAFTSSTALFSNGVAIVVALVGTSYVGKAGANTVFTLDLQQDGHYSFKLLDTLDHPNKADSNDSIALNFGVKGTDTDGDAATTTIRVNVLDDGATAHNDVNTLDIHGHETTATGNVISGLNGGAGAADVKSQDTPNLITRIEHDGATKTVTASGTVIHGDHGTLTIKADGSYTYKADDNWNAAHKFTETLEFPDIPEKQALTEAQKKFLGVKADALDVTYDATATIKFVGEKAGYSNSMGVFTIGAHGEIIGVKFVATNSDTAAGTTANVHIDASAGQQGIGFFLIADGWDVNNGYKNLDLAHGKLSFVYDYNKGGERLATIADDGSHLSLVFTSTSGKETLLHGPTYFTTDRGGSTDLNFDDTMRVISGLADDADKTTLRIGFEDLPKLGDHDYNDTVFDVKIRPDTATDQFKYTLTDGDGDSDTALLTFKLDNNGGHGCIINGTSGDDCLVGTDGNDILVGLAGNDQLYGGHGADMFNFQKLTHGIDHITDFNAAEGDRLDLSALLHSYDPMTHAITDFVFATQSGGNTIIAVDTTGSGLASHATTIAVLDGVTGLKLEDIVHSS